MPQPVDCNAGNAMTFHDFPEKNADRGAKNSLLAGKPDCRRRIESEVILARFGGALNESATSSFKLRIGGGAAYPPNCARQKQLVA
jgi:hypothetical protein